MHIKSRDSQKSLKTNSANELYDNKSKNNHYKVNFNLNLSTTTKKLKNNSGQNRCNYNLWKPYNISPFIESKMSPIRRLAISL